MSPVHSLGNLGDGTNEVLFPAPADTPEELPRHNVALAARVPAELRAEVIQNQRPGEDLSAAVRRLLRLGIAADAQARHALQEPRGRSRRHGTPTERAAALSVAPRAGSQRHRALAAIVRAGARGMTADEVAQAMPECPVNGVARRVADLVEGQLVQPARLTGGDVNAFTRDAVDAGVYRVRTMGPGEHALDDGLITRQTRHGADATVYVPTYAGLTALRQAEEARA